MYLTFRNGRRYTLRNVPEYHYRGLLNADSPGRFFPRFPVRPLLTMSRVGKIARLSQYLRERLNRRIEDGEPGRQLLEWLNELSPVKETLEEHFNGRPITEQNLSEWKQRGFKDWQRNQETRALARDFLAEAEELEEEVGDIPLTDRMAETVTLALARLLREAMDGEKSPAQLRAVIEIARELARWRKQDHQMKRLGREEEIWEQEKADRHKAEMEAMKEDIKHAETLTRFYGNILRREYCEGLKSGTLDPECAAHLRKVFAAHADEFRKFGIKDLPLNGAGTSQPTS